MLSSKAIKMLKILDKQVLNCDKCSLNKNGCSKPFWTSYSKLAVIGEAPGYNEVRKQTPFVGAAGKILTDELSKVGFQARDFLIINTVQCRPVNGSRNGKPNETQILECQQYLRKYLKIVNPEKILCLGNYAKYLFTGDIMGVLRQRGEFKQFKLEGSYIEYPVLFTIHPAYCIYNSEEGIPMLREDIKTFKNANFQRKSDWLLSEEEMLIR